MNCENHFTSLLWHLFRVWKYIAYEFCLPVKLIGLNGRRDSHEIEEPLSFLVLCSSLLLNHRVEIDGRWENMWNKLLFPWFIENHLQPKKHTFIYVPPSNQMFGSLETNQPNCFFTLQRIRELTVWKERKVWNFLKYKREQWLKVWNISNYKREQRLKKFENLRILKM